MFVHFCHLWDQMTTFFFGNLCSGDTFQETRSVTQDSVTSYMANRKQALEISFRNNLMFSQISNTDFL